MSIQLYQILHLVSVILLTAVTFGALAAPRPEERRTSLLWSGLMAVVALVSGFGLHARLGYAFAGWVFVKIACWMGLAALTGLAYRRPAQRRSLTVLAVVAVVLAVGVAIVKPF